ncbi:MAG TPA: HEAT repeat domain-containing protein, partial [Planctomycetota bacterium]|nr:HEAT repeat domain-containing protein [Planctomycetota bacterium]
MCWVGNPLRIGFRGLATSFVLICLAQSPMYGQDLTYQEVLSKFEATRGGFPSEERVSALRDLLGHKDFVVRGPILLKAFQGLIVELDRLDQRVDGLEKNLTAEEAKFRDAHGEKRDALLEGFRELRFEFEMRLRHRHALETEIRLTGEALREDSSKLPDGPKNQRLKDLIARAKRAATPLSLWHYTQLLAPLEEPDIVAFLSDRLHRSKEPKDRIVVADAMAIAGLRVYEAPLISALRDPVEAVRAAVIKALRSVGSRGAVQALVAQLDIEDGRIEDDIVTVLALMTGQNFYTNRPLWQEWVEKQPADWSALKRTSKGLPTRSEKSAKAASFYGLQFVSEGVVYLIDISGSMNDPARQEGTTGAGAKDETKLDRAKRELIKSLESLASGTRVNIIAYNDGLQFFAPEPVVLDDITRRSMVGWTRTLSAAGRTNIYDAIAHVLSRSVDHSPRKAKGAMLVDSILLLSDGLPTEGRVLDTMLLAERVKQLNQMARVVIHTVGVGP